jgi:hypothetical protein
MGADLVPQSETEVFVKPGAVVYAGPKTDGRTQAVGLGEWLTAGKLAPSLP